MENSDYYTPEAALMIGHPLPCDIEPPFWYPCCQVRHNFKPVGNLDDMAFVKLMQPVEKKEWLREMGIDKKEMYLPGEIYKKAPKEMFVMPETDESCSGTWTPRSHGFYEKLKLADFPPITYPLYERVMQREKLSLGHDVVSKTQSSQATSSTKSSRVRFVEESSPSVSSEKQVSTGKRKSCIFYGDRACREHVHIPGTNPCCRRYTIDRKQCLYEMPFWYPACQVGPRHGLQGDIRDLDITRIPPETTSGQNESQQFGNTLYNWSPKDPDFYKKFDPQTIPPPSYDIYREVKRREAMSLNETVFENRSSSSTKSWGDRYSPVVEPKKSCGPNFDSPRS